MGCIGHDAGHFSVSAHRPWVNDWCLWGISWLCNPYMWQHQHTYAHHSFTNDIDHDPDLHHFTSLLRVHKSFQKSGIYKNQSNRWYVFLAYTFVSFGTCFWVPWSMMKEHTLYGMVAWTDQQRHRVAFTSHFLLYFSLIIAWPFYAHTNKLWALAAVVGHMSTSGLLFAFFSQINHLNESSLDSDKLAKLKEQVKPSIRSSWAVDQILTSNNFCPDSLLWHVLSNGLNLQIEHHLFPGLNHCHLSKIAPVVRQTCEEYGVEYKVYPSWPAILQATLDWLDTLAT